MLTDVDIKKLLDRDIVIEPFEPDQLTPVGYDFTVGDFVFSLEKGLLKPEAGVFSLPPKSTIQIMTRESLWVSNRIGGTFHSKVSLVSKGLSHISTTLDPGWYGPLLFTLRNNLTTSVDLKTTASFVTCVFMRVSSPTKTPHLKPAFREDILLRQQLNNQTDAYIKKIGALLDTPRVLREFKQKVAKANQPMMARVLASARSKAWRDALIAMGVVVAVVALVLLPFYGHYLNALLNNVFSFKMIAFQVPTIIAIFALAQARKRPGG